MLLNELYPIPPKTLPFPSDLDPNQDLSTKYQDQLCPVERVAPLLTIPLDVLGHQTSALIDSGAGGNFISHSLIKRLNCSLHKLKCPESVRVASGEVLPITHFVRLYLRMGDLTIRCSLHVTQSTGDIILGYPFLVRFEPLIHWKDRYMEIEHKNQYHRIFGIPARGSLYEYSPNHPQNAKHTDLNTLNLQSQISSIHTQLQQLQTTLHKMSLTSQQSLWPRIDVMKVKHASDPPTSNSNHHPPQQLLSRDFALRSATHICDPPTTSPSTIPTNISFNYLQTTPVPTLHDTNNVSSLEPHWKPSSSKFKPKPKPKPSSLTKPDIPDILPTKPPNYVDITPEDQAAVEALLPQSPKAPKKLLPELEAKQIKEDPIPPEVQKLLDKYKSVFEDHPNTLPKQRDTDHKIELIPDAKIPTHRIYRLTPEQDDELKTQLDKYLKAGQIERSYSPFGASTLFAKKKDGTQRLCIDYRALNDITVKDVYPLPLIDEIIDKFAKCNYFTKIDLQQGFHQIRLHPDSVKKTAFQTKYGSFQFLVMPFGLCNAPATFQRTMNFLLHDVTNTNVFIDDITVYSETLEDHLLHLENLLSRLHKEQFYAKRSKCSFAQQEIEFCGYIVGKHGVRTMPDKLQLIHDWLTPTSAQDIRRFLGLTGFYQKFIPNYAQKAAPLTRLLRKTNPFEWTKAQEDSFNTLKYDMMHSATLTYPNMDKVFIIHTDASDIAVGATLSQEDQYGQLKLIACGSRKLNDAEKNYPPHEQECLAVIDALRRWKYYFRQPPHVFTDNITLKYLTTMKDPSKRMIRWISELSQYSPVIQHIPGSTNTAADAISRQVHLHFLNSISVPNIYKHTPLLPMDFEFPEHSPYPTPEVDPDNWLLDYTNDPWWKTHSNHTFPDGSEGLDPRFECVNGRFWMDNRIVVPEVRAPEIIDKYHNGILQGHWGIAKTVEIIKRKYFIPNLVKHVQQHILTCPGCQRLKVNKQKQRGLLVQLQLPTIKWQSVSMDWISFKDNPRTIELTTYDTVLIFTDRATKMVHLIPTTSHSTADQTAKLFIKHVVKHHGIPRSIHSDRDPRLSSALWQELCLKLDIKHKMTAAYWPQANGQAERTNQTVKQILRFAHDEGLHWYDALDMVEMTINNAPIGPTPHSPYFLNYGFHPTLVPDVYDETLPQFQPALHTPREFMEQLTYNWKVAYNAFLKMKQQQKRQYDLHRQFKTLRIGDYVLVKIADPRLQSLGGSLAAPTSGPYRIIEEIVPDTTYRIDIPDSIFRGNKSFHISKLLPWHGAAPGLTDIPNPSSDSPDVPPNQQAHPPFPPASNLVDLLHYPAPPPRLDNNGQPLPPTHFAQHLSDSPPHIIDTYSHDTVEPAPGSKQPIPSPDPTESTYYSPPRAPSPSPDEPDEIFLTPRSTPVDRYSQDANQGTQPSIRSSSTTNYSQSSANAQPGSPRLSQSQASSSTYCSQPTQVPSQPIEAFDDFLSQESAPRATEIRPHSQHSTSEHHSQTLEEFEQQLSPPPSYDPMQPNHLYDDFEEPIDDSDQDIVDSSQATFVSDITLPMSLPLTHIGYSKRNGRGALSLHAPSLQSRKKNSNLHVHFNDNPEIFIIPRRFCSFIYIKKPKVKRLSWKHIAQHDCEQVKLNPTVFRQAISKLKFKPSADMFASDTHHQLPRYYSKNYDPKAVRTNAFSIDWNLEAYPYVNPPWSLIPKVLEKVAKEQVRIMLVIPYWPSADWYPVFQRMHVRSIILEEPIYLDDQGNLRPKPTWDTQIAIIQG